MQSCLFAIISVAAQGDTKTPEVKPTNCCISGLKRMQEESLPCAYDGFIIPLPFPCLPSLVYSFSIYLEILFGHFLLLYVLVPGPLCIGTTIR
jgi:hypothetical protein